MKTQQIIIRMVWRRIGESIGHLQSLAVDIFLYPLKSFESVSKRGKGRDEDVEGYVADVDVPAIRKYSL